ETLRRKCGTESECPCSCGEVFPGSALRAVLGITVRVSIGYMGATVWSNNFQNAADRTSAAGRAGCGHQEPQWFVGGPAVLDEEDLRSAAFSSVATGCRPASAGGIRNVVSLVSAVVVNPFSSGDHCGLRGSAHRERGLVARVWESIKDETVLS